MQREPTVFISFLLLYFILIPIPQVTSHGRLMRPPSRSSIWRFPEFQHLSPIPNYTDNQLFCGGIHQADNPGLNCGVCGDSFQDPVPRENEYGGRYYKGITVRYQAGQSLQVAVEITAAHLGFMEWRLCLNVRNETQACFNENLLYREDTEESRVEVRGTGKYETRLRLPNGVKCDHCVLQWNYRAGNNWGQCEDGSAGLGCGPQETFRGCADIVIE